MGSNLIKQMKERIAKSGTSKRGILYIGKDSIKRVRFLDELDAGQQFQFHNDWDASIFQLCDDMEDHENCAMCEQEIALQDFFAWSVWSYDDNAVRILLYKATGVSPVPALIEMFEEFGTIKDRDYKIKKVGQGTGGSFVVTPLDKERFKNAKAKSFTKKQMIDILKEAYPAKSDSDSKDDDEEDEEDEVETKKSKNTSKSKKTKKRKTVRDEFEELTWGQLKEIATEIGVSKKQIRSFDEDENELIDYLFDEFEEEDLKELLEDLDVEDDDEDEDDD